MIVLLIIVLILVLGFTYTGVRNEFVYRFRMEVINMCDNDVALTIFVDGPGYKTMLFSLKPLKLKYWYTPEQIKTLQS
jgi:hypothetical protein